MAMAPKREPTSAEYQQVLDENDALRAEIVKLKWKLENCEMIRQEQASYICEPSFGPGTRHPA